MLIEQYPVNCGQRVLGQIYTQLPVPLTGLETQVSCEVDFLVPETPVIVTGPPTAMQVANPVSSIVATVRSELDQRASES